MPKGMIRSSPIETAGPDKDAAITPLTDESRRVPPGMKERVDTIKKTFDAKTDADALKAQLEARGYEVVIREYYEPAVDLDNYYAELTAQKRWLVDAEEEGRAEEEAKRKLARASLGFKVGLAVFILIIVILFLGLFGPHLLRACRAIF